MLVKAPLKPIFSWKWNIWDILNQVWIQTLAICHSWNWVLLKKIQLCIFKYSTLKWIQIVPSSHKTSQGFIIFMPKAYNILLNSINRIMIRAARYNSLISSCSQAKVIPTSQLFSFFSMSGLLLKLY